MELGLTGLVRNMPDGSLEVCAEGDKGKLEQLVDYLKEGSPASRVDKVVANWSKYSGDYSEFRVKY